jgi:hypothetical protein
VAAAVSCTGEVFQLYVYGAVPPIAIALTSPLLPPLQATLVIVDVLAASIVGSVTVADAVLVQLCASVTVTV